jgi:predicted nucleic-acid-binding Zn-ribbon protein
MKDGTCPKCGSAEIYMSNSPYPDSIFVKSNTPSIETFTTSAYICLDCGHLEMYVSDTSVALFGKGKSLKESIPASNTWEKV